MDLSPQVKQFLQRHIRSVWELELLLLMKKNAQAFDAKELARRLYIDDKAAATALAKYERLGLLKRAEDSSKFMYAPASDELAQAVDATASAYGERRTAVINNIFSSSLQSFADAFKIRTEDDE